MIFQGRTDGRARRTHDSRGFALSCDTHLQVFVLVLINPLSLFQNKKQSLPGIYSMPFASLHQCSFSVKKESLLRSHRTPTSTLTKWNDLLCCSPDRARDKRVVCTASVKGWSARWLRASSEGRIETRKRSCLEAETYLRFARAPVSAGIDTLGKQIKTNTHQIHKRKKT